MATYRRTIGNQWELFYKIDKENKIVQTIEIRWADKVGGKLEGYFINCQGDPFRNYDKTVVDAVIETQEKETYEGFEKVKKQAISYIRQL